MKQVAFIDNTGQVMTVMSPGTDDMFVDGELYGDYVAKDIPYDADGTLYIREKFWNNNQWNTREPNPGEYYEWLNYQWTFNQEAFDTSVRRIRNDKLKASDWAVLPDVPLDETKKLEWGQYRQALRDITDNISGLQNINEVPWPLPPT
jgi:hypothetical protein